MSDKFDKRSTKLNELHIKIKQQNFRLGKFVEITSCNIILQMRKFCLEILDYSFFNAMELEENKMNEETKSSQHDISSRNLNK